MQTPRISRMEGGTSDAHAIAAEDGLLPLGWQPDPAPPHRHVAPAPPLDSPSGRPFAVGAAAPAPCATPAGNDGGMRGCSAAETLRLNESPIVDLPQPSPPTPIGLFNSVSPRPQLWQAGEPVQQLPQYQLQHKEEVWALTPLPDQLIAEPPVAEYSQQPPAQQPQAPHTVPAARSASVAHLAMQHSEPGAEPPARCETGDDSASNAATL